MSKARAVHAFDGDIDAADPCFIHADVGHKISAGVYDGNIHGLSDLFRLLLRGGYHSSGVCEGYRDSPCKSSQRIQKCGNIGGFPGGNAEIGHRSLSVHRMRIANPSLQIVRAVDEHAGDVRAIANTCQRGPSEPTSSVDFRNLMTGSTTVSRNEFMAAIGIAAV